MTFRPRLWSLMLAGSLALGGCAVVPVDEYGYYEDDYGYYERDTVIVTPPPRVEYRGLPPTVGYVWIDGYWDWIGHRHDWVPGYWAPPGTRARPIVRHRHFERERDDERRERWWRDRREDSRDRDGDRRREDSRRDERWKDWRGELRDREGSRERDGIRDRDGDRDRAGVRDRDGIRAPDFFRERRDERERSATRERERERRIEDGGAQARPQFIPRERIQAEAERRRAEEARAERRPFTRAPGREPNAEDEPRRRGEDVRSAPGERRGDEREGPTWRARLREAGAN